MSDLGALLKKARLEKDISMEQLQETTKIQKRYLEAIEAGNFNILPGNFYVRAFIKSYSEAVGLDPDEVLRLYRNVIPQVALQPNVEPVRKNRKKSFNTDRISKWASTLLMWFFPLLILAVFYVYWTQHYEPKPTVDENNIPITDAFEEPDDLSPDNDIATPDPIAEPEVEEELPPEPQVTYVMTDGNTYIYNVSNLDTLKVEMKVIGARCWVRVRENNSSGNIIIETEYAKDHVESWETDHSLHIRMGNPSSVEVRINDVLIDMEKMLESNPFELQINFVTEADVENS